MTPLGRNSQSVLGSCKTAERRGSRRRLYRSGADSDRFSSFSGRFEKAIEKHKPDVVICAGQAGGRAHITPERIAINIDDARIPDNEDREPIDEPIAADGPAAYWSALPIKLIVKELRKTEYRPPSPIQRELSYATISFTS